MVEAPSLTTFSIWMPLIHLTWYTDLSNIAAGAAEAADAVAGDDTEDDKDDPAVVAGSVVVTAGSLQVRSPGESFEVKLSTCN